MALHRFDVGPEAGGASARVPGVRVAIGRLAGVRRATARAASAQAAMAQAASEVLRHLGLWLGVLAPALAAVPGVRAVEPVRVPVTFVVRAPEGTPPDATLYVAGNAPELGPWDPGKVALRRADARVHAVTVELPAGFPLEYKVTRGSWETVEKGPAGEEIANRRFSVPAAAPRQPQRVEIEVAKWRDQVEATAPKRPSALTGDVRHLGRIHSQALGNDRDVWVYLPPSYADSSERRYPVIYFHDGQNVFDAATAFIGIEWGADETLEKLAAAGEMRPAIAVGVANTPQRIEEYTQATDARRPGSPRADAYLQFLVRELKPKIDAEFRTLPGRAQTAIVGSSLGGLVSLYAGVAAWETFGLVAGVSPVVQWGDHDLERRWRDAPAAQLPMRVWIDMGTAEDASDVDPDSRVVRELRRFRDVLVGRGYVVGRDLRCVEDPGAPHNEAAWARRLPDILRFLMPPEPVGGSAGR